MGYAYAYPFLFLDIVFRKGLNHLSEFTEKIIAIIRAIPEGRVATYGQIAALAGHPRAPRQVAGILKRYSNKYDLPWHRVVGIRGTISIKDPVGKAEQVARLREEGVDVSTAGTIDLSHFGWKVDCFDLDSKGI